MQTTIRARLVLLTLAVLVPGIAAALLVISRTYQSERDEVRRGLISNARALAQVIDHELQRRVDIAEAMSNSYLMVSGPMDETKLRFLHSWTGGIAADLDGWIEIRSADAVLLDTRLPPGAPPRPLPADVAGFFQHPVLLALQRESTSGSMRAQVVQPIQRDGHTTLNLVIAVPPEALQKVIDRQKLPDSWVGTVIDSQHQVVARHPGGVAYAGRLASPDMRARLATENERLASSVTLDGVAVLSTFSKTSQNWNFLVASPSGQNLIFDDLPSAVTQVVSGALLLIALAILAAAWVARGIERAARALQSQAQSLHSTRAAPVAGPMAIQEFDAVSQAMTCAWRSLHSAREDLERQVEQAIGRTRLAEKRVSQGQRIAALGRLTGGVAHDFNNLLGVISNSAYLMRRHVPALPELQMPLDVIQRSVDMGGHLSQQLLRFGARQAVTPRLVDLSIHLPELRGMLQMVTRQNIEVGVSVMIDTPLVRVDPSELELALINMALNARDAMPHGGWLRVVARPANDEDGQGLPPGGYVLITVSDNGVGMDEELAAHVFEPFFTTKAVGQGTGLGLSQVHGFCVQAGGTAHMRSTPGLGSTVSMVLPAFSRTPARTAPDRLPAPPGGFRVNGAPPEPAAAVPEDLLASLRGVRLLLVEDLGELATVTSALLETHGLQVQRAADVDQAIEAVNRDASLQLVLSDVTMPGTRNGVDLAMMLREIRPTLPVVLVSGYSAALAGLSGFTVLRKPVAPALLLETLANALRAAARPADARDGDGD